ncbi:MAG TPA: hypothetical protein VGP07_22330 [Polyangia bacterium]
MIERRFISGLRPSAKRWERSLFVLLLSCLFASCGEESLVKINVTGDVSYTNVELRVTANGGAVQQSFLNATFGPGVVFKAGLYLPSKVTGTVSIEADAYRNKCLVGTKTVTVPKVTEGQPTAEVPIEVIGTGSTCPVDGGGGGKGGGAGGAVGAGGKAGTGGVVGTGGRTGSGGVVGTGGTGTGGAGTGGIQPGTGGTGSGGNGTGGDRGGSGGRTGSGGRDGTGGRGDRGGEGGLAVVGGGGDGEGGREARGGAGGRTRGDRGGDRGNGGGDSGTAGDSGAGGGAGLGGIGVILPPIFADSTSSAPVSLAMSVPSHDWKAWACTF